MMGQPSILSPSSPANSSLFPPAVVALINLKGPSSASSVRVPGTAICVGGKKEIAFSCSPTPGKPPRSDPRELCRASQAFDLFSPPVCPEVVVRDARLEDCWEVAETHCSSFFPNYTFPLDIVLRIDRFVALLSGFSIPPGCMRSCLVAITGCSIDDNLYFGTEELNFGGLEGKFSFNRGSVVGILTVDTVADFLPRKGPLRQRRTGIAYISNVAVREKERRKGIAKSLIAKAEARAQSWGCHAIALHCDTMNLAAARLYKGLGFRSINVPEHANWPQPKTSPDTQFIFMMKLLTSGSCADW